MRESRNPGGGLSCGGFSACSVLGFSVLLATFGCQSPGDQMYRLQKQVDSQKARVVELEERIITLQKQIDDQKQQIITLQRIAPDRMAKLEVPVKIELDKLSGGCGRCRVCAADRRGRRRDQGGRLDRHGRF